MARKAPPAAVATAPADEAAAELLTLRDFMRWSVGRFNAAGIAYGQGTADPVDEAAFLILETLRLPVDRLDPFLDARLTSGERKLLADRIEARATGRVPAAYLAGAAYIQGVRFRADARAIVPRSFIGELIATGQLGAGGLDLVPDDIGSILDLCTGSGSLAILAAMAWRLADIDAVELSPDAAALAAENVADHGLGDRVRILPGDLWQPVAKRRYDLVITNPPYVDAAAMADLPPEFRHEPDMALAGGEDGLDIVRRIVDGAAAHLNPGGGLLCEVGRGREALEAAYPHLPFLWIDTEASEGEVFWIGADDLPSPAPRARKPRGR